MHYLIFKTLSGRKKMLSKFYQNFTSSLSMYMEFKSIEILVKFFFVSKIGRAFYLVFDFFNSAQTYFFNLCYFFYNLKSQNSVIRIRLNFFNIIFRSGDKLKISFVFLTVRTYFWTFFGQKIKHIN